MNAPDPALHPLIRLNDAQLAAVRHGLDGAAHEPLRPAPPLLVIAGAGSGKTHTLAHRVAELIRRGANPAGVLLLTFSRRAAEEMRRRVQRLLPVRVAGRGEATLPWAGTFHGIGARLLREFAPAIGLDPGFTVHDRGDAADLMNFVRHELGLSARHKRFPLKGTCLAIYSATVNTQAPVAEVLRSAFPWCREWSDDLRRLFGAYVDAKQAQQVLDYDDLLLYWAQMMTVPGIATELGERFPHVLVDEYQDTNRLQADLLRALKPDGRGLTVVGDDAQSIYAFRGASVRNILDFPQAFDPPATQVTLAQNYRSTQAILDAANGVIGLAGERFAKNLWSTRTAGPRPRLVHVRDEAGQAGQVVEAVLARREQGLGLKAQAVLFRAAHHSAPLELELTRRNIPFVKFGGLKFLEAAHIKDVLALLRWAQNPRDRLSGFRAIQLLPGFGPKGARRILDNLAAAPDGAELLAEQSVPEGRRETWRAFAELIAEVRNARATWPGSVERACLWYAEAMDRLFDDAAVRRADIDQLARIAATYPDCHRFLTDLTLDPPEATSDQAGVPLLDEDYLILSTIHSAKGQEWDAVTVLNVVDGCIPSDLATGSAAEIDEERRLLYVAMTRARDELDLIVPQRFYTGHPGGLADRHVYAGRTRFIPNALLPAFDQTVWPLAVPDGAPLPGAQGVPVADLKARMRAMWE